MKLNIIDLLCVFIGIIPLSMFIGVRLKTLEPLLKILIIYLLVSLMTDMIGLFIIKVNNFILYNIFTYAETTLVLIMYLQISKNRKYVKHFIFLLSAFSICFVYVAIYKNTIHTNHTLMAAVEALMFICIGVLYFFRLINTISSVKLTDYYFFWFNAAFLIYFSGSFFIFLLTDLRTIIGVFHNYSNIWTMHNIIYILINVLFARGVYAWRKAQRLAESDSISTTAKHS